MNIDVAAFTPLASTIGGALIGIGTAVLLLGSGRIAGVSGIASGVFTGTPADRQWRLAFLLGLTSSPLLYALLASTGIFGADNTGSAPVVVEAGLVRLALSGLLVGIGTGLASGCTSGHGVCGTARLSPRSLLATALFMTSAIVVVFIARHVVANT